MRPESITAQERATRCGDIMFSEDTTAQSLGMTLLSIGPGSATLSMKVRKEQTNGHGICHGGYIFLLADTAFAYACNSHNQRAVAAGASIEFLAAGQLGDTLTAVATEQHRAARSGIYDIRVTNHNQVLIAVFRGKAATIKGQFFEESPETNTP
jgi:acyl-CoA thioesterase